MRTRLRIVAVGVGVGVGRKQPGRIEKALSFALHRDRPGAAGYEEVGARPTAVGRHCLKVYAIFTLT